MGIQVIADVAGLPVYFIDRAIPEPAGDGNVRVINYETRKGILIPRFEVIIHSTKLMIAGRAVADVAQHVFNQEMLAQGTAH